jgi:hypothetical protein
MLLLLLLWFLRLLLLTDIVPFHGWFVVDDFSHDEVLDFFVDPSEFGESRG